MDSSRDEAAAGATAGAADQPMINSAAEEISSVRAEAQSTRSTELNVIMKEVDDGNRIQSKKLSWCDWRRWKKQKRETQKTTIISPVNPKTEPDTECVKFMTRKLHHFGIRSQKLRRWNWKATMLQKLMRMGEWKGETRDTSVTFVILFTIE